MQDPGAWLSGLPRHPLRWRCWRGTLLDTIAVARVPTKVRGWRALTFASVLLAAFVVRFAGINSEPFWLDEIFSFNFTDGTFRQVLDGSSFDAHPPLYYLVLWLWRLCCGSSELAIRLLSTVWSLIGIAIAMLFAAQVARDWRAGLLAGVLGSVSPLDIYFAQEARGYAQAGALFVLSSWLLFRWTQETGSPETGRPRALLKGGYVVAAAMLLHTHYLGVFLLAAHAVWGVGWFASRKAWRAAFTFVSAVTLAAASLAPWLMFVRSRGGFLEPRDWVGWLSSPTWTSAFEPLTRYLLWGNAPRLPGAHATGLVCSGVLLGVVLGALQGGARREERRLADVLFPAWLVAGPVAIAVAFSLSYQPVYFAPRFTQLLVPTFLVAVGSALLPICHRWHGVVLAAALFTTMGFATWAQQATIQKVAPLEFAEVWESRGPPDLAVLFPDWEHVAIDYYLKRPLPRARTREQIEGARRSRGRLVVWLCKHRHHVLTPSEQELRSWLLSHGAPRAVRGADPFEIIEVLLD